MTFEETIEKKQVRAELLASATALLNRADSEKRDLMPDESRNYSDLLGRAEKLGRELVDGDPAALRSGRVTRLEDHVEAGVAVTDTGREIRMLGPADSFRSTVRHTPEGENKLSLGKTLRGLITSDWGGADAERRALSSGGSAGFLLSPTLGAQVIDLARAKSTVIAAGARIIPMDEGELVLARIKTDPVATWRPENAPLNSTDVTFDAIRLKPKTLGAFIKIPVELAADARNIEEVVSAALTKALGLEMDRVLFYGGGANEPKGLRNYIGDADQPIGTQDPAGPLTDYDDFSLAQQGIRQANFQANAVIFSPRSWGQLDRAVTGIAGDKTPLTPPQSWAELQRFVTSQVLDTFSTTESDAFVGQFDQFLIGVRNQVIVDVSREAGDSFKDLQVWVRGYLRVDAALARSGAFQIVTGIEA